MKKYNFNAGPSMLPREVIENTAKQCLDYNGSGLSLMEISHRAKDFQPVVDEAVALIKELLQIPDGYSVIFLGGGASLEFCMVPYNFLINKAAYLNTGTWAKKAMNDRKVNASVVTKRLWDAKRDIFVRRYAEALSAAWDEKAKRRLDPEYRVTTIVIHLGMVWKGRSE